MNVPPVIPAKPTGAATALAASTGAGGEDFASMIPTVQDDGQPAGTIDEIGSEFPPGPAVATTVELTDTADRPMVQMPDSVIQSLIAESKPQSNESSPFGSELQRVGDIEAMLATPTSPGAKIGDGATKEAVAGERPVSIGRPSELAQPITPAPTVPNNPTKELRGPASLASVLPDITDSAHDQPAKPLLTQQVSSGSVITVPAVHETVGASPVPGSTVAIDDGVPRNGQPAPLLIPPVADQATASTDISLGANDKKPRTAEASQGGTINRNAATGPAPGASVGNSPAPVQNPTGMVDVTATPDFKGPEASMDGASQTAGTPSGGTAAKAAPMASGAGANPAAAQSGVIIDTAAAFGGDLRLGADSVRPASVDQAFRGQPLQPASEQVAVQISRAVQQGTDRITVHLKPASLGHISIDLEIGPDNRLIAVIAVDRPETLELMQRDARALERALNDAGLKTDSGSLSFNLRGDGSGNHAGGDDATDWSSFAAPDNADDPTPMPVYARSLNAGGSIDIRV